MHLFSVRRGGGNRPDDEDNSYIYVVDKTQFSCKTTDGRTGQFDFPSVNQSIASFDWLLAHSRHTWEIVRSILEYVGMCDVYWIILEWSGYTGVCWNVWSILEYVRMCGVYWSMLKCTMYTWVCWIVLGILEHVGTCRVYWGMLECAENTGVCWNVWSILAFFIGHRAFIKIPAHR